ncbi:hypothetical protein HLB44_06310 [Aquincola sp. S2]|uniref:Type II secretion system protein GspC N-terminal domain-containing protein n=1 Tax=Pseudaquabacterium terrae TaxID=2732868 RepID=A0ABX2EBS5_9BURK|nr:type II secretion system protein N [Aquabacterium terrae]NRF66590.1 hypothetical protein [Aquabacterium terrae]
MSSRLFAFVIWAVVAASAAFWGFRLLAKPVPVPPQATQAQAAMTPAAGDLTRLFGAPAADAVAEAAPQPGVESRFKLLGVVAPAVGQRSGLALIAIDGGAAKAVALGGRVDGEWTLVAISHRRVELGAGRAGQPNVALELPALAEAARGELPSPGAAPSPVPPQAAPRQPPQPQPAPMMRRPAQPLPFGVTPNPSANPQPNPPPFGVTPSGAAMPAPMAPSEPVTAVR